MWWQGAQNSSVRASQQCWIEEQSLFKTHPHTLGAILILAPSTLLPTQLSVSCCALIPAIPGMSHPILTSGCSFLAHTPGKAQPVGLLSLLTPAWPHSFLPRCHLQPRSQCWQTPSHLWACSLQESKGCRTRHEGGRKRERRALVRDTPSPRRSAVWEEGDQAAPTSGG